MGDIISGARGGLYIGKDKIAQCTGVNVSGDDTYDAFEPIDTVTVQEFVPQARRFRADCALVRMLNKSTTAMGIRPTNEQFKAGGFELTMKVVDSVSKKTLYTLIGVRLEGDHFALPARGMATANLTFVARDMLDEATQGKSAGI